MNNPPITEFEYNKLGNLRFVTDPLGNVTEYQYDARYRLVKVIQPDPDGVGGASAPETDYEYDDAGQLISVASALEGETAGWHRRSCHGDATGLPVRSARRLAIAMVPKRRLVPRTCDSNVTS